MASNRSNLALDEQSFQGLLAAAFTIQEHNDRANAGLDLSGDTGSALPKPEPSKLCSKCGAQLPSADASCPTCHEGLRPGERLQRNWASMWLMSQDLNVNTGRKHEGDLPLSPADPGLVHRDAVEHNEAHQEPTFAAWPVGENTVATSHDAPTEQSEDEGSDSLAAIELEEALPELEADSSVPDPEIEAVEARGPRVRLRFQRADLYLGLAVLVLVGVLLWPTGTSKEPRMPVWERMLIAIGIAEEPQPAVHYHGDPDLKVWVDTHTALYYCPGDELYGKSPGGYYSTQRDAQSDRFEPAERSVCVE